MTVAGYTTQNNVMNGRLSHLSPDEHSALVAFVDRLSERYGDDLLHVVLFGSKARADFDIESDLDILIVLRFPPGAYRHYWNEIVDIAWEIEFAYGVVTSLIIKDEREYATMRHHALLLAQNIEQQGITLWTRQPGVTISEFA